MLHAYSDCDECERGWPCVWVAGWYAAQRIGRMEPVGIVCQQDDDVLSVFGLGRLVKRDGDRLVETELGIAVGGVGQRVDGGSDGGGVGSLGSHDGLSVDHV